jgi:hypothetical protein
MKGVVVVVAMMMMLLLTAVVVAKTEEEIKAEADVVERYRTSYQPLLQGVDQNGIQTLIGLLDYQLDTLWMVADQFASDPMDEIVAARSKAAQISALSYMFVLHFRGACAPLCSAELKAVYKCIMKIIRSNGCTYDRGVSR